LSDKAPNSIPWPPLIYATAAAIGLALSHVWHPVSVDSQTARFVGAGLIFCALALDIVTFQTFRKHRTTIMPHKAASHLITSGPFEFTRNPIYVANTMLLAGVGLGFDYPIMILLALPAAWLTQKLAIEREERHLAEKFGEAWTSYAAETPRWLI
jgi:protein-S-isoprenylcysteine O-methyltransferase Ste14